MISDQLSVKARLILMCLTLIVLAGKGAVGVCAEKTVVWDVNTLVQVHRGGTYPRMMRLDGGDILCAYEDWGKCWVKRSADNGRTWGEPVLAAESKTVTACNPELLQLANGWVLLFYNERPGDGVHQFTIQVAMSKDDAQTWRHHCLAYTADTKPENGCWEPAGIQLPSGEIQLFFANESPYRQSNEQEITLVRSFDNGKTWSKPKTVSFRAGHRDGMPVPLALKDGKGIVLAIEDNGFAHSFRPVIIHTSVADNWDQPYAGATSPRRWRALRTGMKASWTGAPYIRQMPTGETILSFQTNEGGREKPQMVVYVGDENARNFGGRSVPFEVPPDHGGWWNSLFVKDEKTITAISCCNGGIWAIDGRVSEVMP